MDRAKIIVALAADQARDEATKAWILDDEKGVFLAWAKDLMAHVQPWEAVALADRRISLLLWGWACESMLAQAREDVATLQGTVEILDERVAELLHDNAELVTEYMQRGVDEARDAELEALTARMDEDMCITCDMRAEEFETRRDRAA